MEEQNVFGPDVREFASDSVKESNSEPSIPRSDHAPVKTPVLRGSPNEESSQTVVPDVEYINRGRQTRRSAAVALAAIRSSRTSYYVASSNSSSSEVDNTDDEYQEDSEDDSSEKEACAQSVPDTSPLLLPPQPPLPPPPNTGSQEVKGHTSSSYHSFQQNTYCLPLSENQQHRKGVTVQKDSALQQPNCVVSTEQKMSIQNSDLKSDLRVICVRKAGVSILKPLLTADARYHQRDISENRGHNMRIQINTQQGIQEIPVLRESSDGTNDESALQNKSTHQSYQPEMTNTYNSRTKNMKLECRQYFQESAKQNTNKYNEEESNQYKQPVGEGDNEFAGKTIIHPTSGLLVFEICNETGSLDGNGGGTNNGSVQYECQKCKQIFNSQEYEHTHGAPINEAKQLFTCNICGKEMFLHFELAMHFRNHEKKNEIKSSCPICKKLLSSKKKMKFHMVTVHNTIRSHSCNICDKSFKTINCLKLHLRVHSDERPYKCNICGESFKYSSKIVEHIRSHMGTHPTVKCHVCGKMCRVSSFKLHLLCHSSEKPFQCDICFHKFVSKRRLRDHVRIVHENGINKHICDVCGKVLNSPSNLKDHLNLHSGEKPYTCHVCGKSFIARSRLIVHCKIHEEKKFKCDVCGVSCNRLDNLTSHIRSHTGEKPYRCLFCNKSFTRQDNMQTHMHSVHKLQGKKEKSII